MRTRAEGEDGLGVRFGSWGSELTHVTAQVTALLRAVFIVVAGLGFRFWGFGCRVWT
jgi:hypothetical protein